MSSIHIARYRNGQALAYVDFGDPRGYPVLIQHGLIASIRDTSLFARLIDQGARLISVARPGYGESAPCVMQTIGEWAELAAPVIQELRLARFDVLGISSGAPYSYALGHKFPDQARHLYILGGTPALYAGAIQAVWPYPLTPNASLAELQTLAHDLFFSGLSPADLAQNDIQDSLKNNCFGLAQDLKLRCLDWGFDLSTVRVPVYMRHSRADQSVPFVTAQLTAGLLPHCQLEIRETDAHFSNALLDDFLKTVVGPRLPAVTGSAV